MTPAVQAATRGWAVFPLRPGDKRPAVDNWERRACADPAAVAAYWPARSGGHGIACGPSRLVVIDLDVPKDGKDLPEAWKLPGIVSGADVLAWICEAAGMDWPSTYTVFTPSGGMHLYFTAPDGSAFRNTASAIGPMIDTRAAGGYVVGGGSVTSAGEYVVTDDQPARALPNWIARLLEPPPEHENTRRPYVPRQDGPRSVAGLLRTVAEAREGNRNNALFWAACHLAKESPGDLGQLAEAAAAIGLDGREIRQTIASARKRVAA